jgi:LysM repeat protein
MKPRSSSIARVAAASALVLALIVAIVVIGSATGGDSDSRDGTRGAAHKSHKKKRHIPASYEIQSGDTLTSIAHETGVPVREIEALNPRVDPQILIAGEELKLR